MFRPILPLLFFLITLVAGMSAQDAVSRDTLASRGEPAPDTTGFTMAKSPWGAVLRSAVLPGWGQFYNESYWKIPIVLGLSGFLLYGIITEHGYFIDYRDQYAKTITPLNPSGDLRLKQFREFYRDYRDTYGWWFLVAYLAQLVDAFVDAHLYDFDVSDEVHAQAGFAPPARITFSLRW